MQGKERKEALKILKHIKNKSLPMKETYSTLSNDKHVSISDGTSTSSSNGDWKNWIILHANFDVAVEDVCGIAEAIKVKCNGDKMNMYNLLSRVDGRVERVR